MKAIAGLIIIGVVILLMAITNPTREEFNTYFSKGYEKQSLNIFQSYAINRVLKSAKYENYIIISVVTIEDRDSKLLFLGGFKNWIPIPIK